MSFGFSIGDFILVTQIASQLQQSYRSAPEDLRALDATLETFQTLSAQIQRDIADPATSLGRATAQQLTQLSLIAKNIDGVLRKLEAIRQHYEHIEEGSRRVWNRIRFPREEVRFLQAQLQFYIIGLNFFLQSLSSEMLTRVVNLLEQMAEQEQLSRATWGSLLGATRQRGIPEEVILPHRADIESLVRAANDVVETSSELSPHSSLRLGGSSSGSASSGIFSFLGDARSGRGNDNNGSIHSDTQDYTPFMTGPPDPRFLESRVCPGALKLKNGQGGISQRRRVPLFGSSKYKIQCTDCHFMGFQDEKLENLTSPRNTPLFFTTRQRKFTPSDIEYYLQAQDRVGSEPDGLFYRTLFFWKCHVPARVDTLHDFGEYECPFCDFHRSAGIFYDRSDLLEHILEKHVRMQPSVELQRQYNCWFQDSPMLFRSMMGRLRGRGFDLLLPRAYTDREGARARMAAEDLDDGIAHINRRRSTGYSDDETNVHRRY